MHHLILDTDTRRENLMDPATGALTYPVGGVDRIERLFLRPGLENAQGTPYFLVYMWDRSIQDYTRAWTYELTDADGKALLRRSRIEVWYEGSRTREPILCVELPVEDGSPVRKVLADLQGNALSIPFDSIDRYHPYAKRITIRRDGKINYLESDTFRPMSQLWFESDSFTHKLHKEHCNEPDYLACVKYGGRFRVLRTDGTLDAI
jgi:hypothetical protein